MSHPRQGVWMPRRYRSGGWFARKLALTPHRPGGSCANKSDASPAGQAAAFAAPLSPKRGTRIAHANKYGVDHRTLAFTFRVGSAVGTEIVRSCLLVVAATGEKKKEEKVSGCSNSAGRSSLHQYPGLSVLATKSTLQTSSSNKPYAINTSDSNRAR